MRQEDAKPRAGQWPSRVEWFVVALIVSGISFRLVALPFAAILVIVPAVRLGKYRGVLVAALVVALASPVDLGVPGSGRLDGTLRGGVRLVRVSSPCQPMRSVLRARYGEFLLASWPCLYQPGYVVVWW
jgi:hypothetical protein